MPSMSDTAHARFWASTKRLTAWLLAAWLLVNLLAPWFARDLNMIKVGGFPLGFWIAAQGALIAYLVIILVYVWRMDRLEASYLDEASPAAPRTRGDGGPPT
jgi:putative solute:sodium symporter small subunit